VVAGDGEYGNTEGGEEPVGPLVLVAPAPVRQVARSDDDLRRHAGCEPDERLLDVRVLACAYVEIGNMQDACGHERMRVNVTPVSGTGVCI
jgi:hypothetical protein